MIGENKEKQKGDETAEEKAERLNFEEAEELIKREAQGGLEEYIDAHDEIKKTAEEKIGDPQKREPVIEENNRTKTETESTWSELRGTMRELENDKEEPAPTVSPEQVPEGVGAGNSETQKTLDYLNTIHNKENSRGTATEENNENVGESLEEEVPEEVKQSAEYVEQVENHFHRKVDKSEKAKDEDVRSEGEKKLIEEYENAEDKEAVIEKTKQRYAENLQSLPEYDKSKEIKENIVEAQKKIEKRLADAELTKGMENKEIKFDDVLERGRVLLDEGDPKKIAEYFGGMADVFEDSSKFAQYMYLQMESDPDPQMREKFKKEYVSFVSDIQRLDEAAKALRELADKAKTAHEKGVALSEADLKDMRLLLETLGKAAAFIVGFGAAVYKIAEYAKTLAIAHPTVSKTIGWTFAGVVGRYTLSLPPAALTAKVACVVAAIALLAKESWRDKAFKTICGVDLPFEFLKAPTPAQKTAGKS